MIIVMGTFWEKIILKVILKNKWGAALTNNYFEFEKNEEVKNSTIHDSIEYCTRGLSNEDLPEDMINYISKIETASGIFQYFFLGLLMSFGYMTFAEYIVGYNIRVFDLVVISVVNFGLFTWYGVSWLPLLFSLAVFFITCNIAKMTEF
jgi:hypothetical protein